MKEANQKAANVKDLTMRDYFAAVALEGMLSNDSAIEALCDCDLPPEGELCRKSYQLADAMLKVREA